MSERYEREINTFLVEVFHDILKTEELCTTADCPDLSLRELAQRLGLSRSGVDHRLRRIARLARGER